MVFIDEIQKLAHLLNNEGIRTFTLQDTYLTMEGLVRAIDRDPVTRLFGTNKAMRDSYLGAFSTRGAIPILARQDNGRGWQLELAVCVHDVESMGTLTSDLENLSAETINRLPVRDANNISFYMEDAFRVLELKLNFRSDAVRLVLLPINQYNEIIKNELVIDQKKRTIYLQGINEDSTAQEILYAILKYAITHNISDIHIEPDPFIDRHYGLEVASLEDLELVKKDAAGKPIRGGRVRYRQFGVLITANYILTPANIRKLVALVKLKCDMQMDIHNEPQDGRIKFDRDDLGRIKELTDYDLRVSVIPTVHGENAVMRLLSKKSENQTMDDLGFTAKQLEIFRKRINEPKGLILVTGPTGSGKTTTLYAGLAEINDGTRNITTIEDPVEKVMPGLIQTQINEATGMTFAKFSRAVLRQDPNSIFIGEIRDQETLETAVRAAITGHLVWSTIHVDCSLDVPLRLKSLGAEGVYVASALLMVISQRLIRRLCIHCCENYEGLEDLEKYLGVGKIGYKSVTLKRAVTGRKCQYCHGTGYYGRLLIPEIWTPSIPERNAISSGELDLQTFIRIALDNGFRPMVFQAMAKVISGETDIDEVLRGSVTSDEMTLYAERLAASIQGQLLEFYR